MVIMFLLRSASTSPTKQKLLHLPDMLAMKPLFSQPGKGASRDSAPRYSCRVLQRLIEHCRHQKLRKLLENLLNEARRPDLRLTFDSCCGIPRFGFGEKRKRERERDFYFTAFGVFRRPPWKELSCKLQTALAQAQQQHGFCCRTWCYLWITQLLCKTALCVKEGLDAKTLVLFKPGFWKRPYWERLWKRPYLERLCV